jgi:pimeloyl-ACP methyl ester carboxylesterase
MRIAVLFASLFARGALLAFLTAAAWAAAAPATLGPSQFNSGAPVDGSALGTRTPLLLVHGLGGSGQGWENFLQAYAQNPAWRAVFKPYTFKYSSSAADVLADPTAPRTISGLGAALRDAMQGYYDRPAAAPDFGFGRKSVVVLAHSMGGLVARAMMQEQVFRDGQRGGQKVLHLITLGTPHQGTPLADAAFSLNLQSELSDGFFGFIADMAWTNYDALDAPGLRCNNWLAGLNNYAPSAGAGYGRCGSVAGNPLPGYYEKIIAYGAATLQTPDLQIGLGAFKPGSAPSYLIPYGYLHDALPRSYRNDGMVPLASSQFEGAPIAQAREVFDCDPATSSAVIRSRCARSWRATATGPSARAPAAARLSHRACRAGMPCRARSTACPAASWTRSGRPTRTNACSTGPSKPTPATCSPRAPQRRSGTATTSATTRPRSPMPA